MNRGLRRDRAEKVAFKRWWRYHAPREFGHGIFKSLSLPWWFGMPIGWYRKKKGCECRGCSANHQREKQEKNEGKRTAFRNHKTEVINRFSTG